MRAGDLPGVLDAAGDAFEDVLAVIHDRQDPEDGMFIPFVRWRWPLSNSFSSC